MSFVWLGCMYKLPESHIYYKKKRNYAAISYGMVCIINAKIANQNLLLPLQLRRKTEYLIISKVEYILVRNVIYLRLIVHFSSVRFFPFLCIL